MFVYPVNQNDKLPELFIQHAQVVENPSTLSYEEIAANRDAWIEAWSDLMK